MQSLFFLQPSLKFICNIFYLIGKQQKKNISTSVVQSHLQTRNNSSKDKCKTVNQLDMCFSLDLNLEKNVSFSPFMLEDILSILLQCQHRHILKYDLRGKLHETLIYMHLSKAQLQTGNTREVGTQRTKKELLVPLQL